MKGRYPRLKATKNPVNLCDVVSPGALNKMVNSTLAKKASYPKIVAMDPEYSTLRTSSIADRVRIPLSLR